MNSKRINNLIAIGVLALFPFLASYVARGAEGDPLAEKSDVEITVIGFRSCKDWTRMRKNDARGVDFGIESGAAVVWLQGFLTGLNATGHRGDALQAIDYGILQDWLDKYCKTKPDSNLFDGGIELYGELAKQTKPPANP